MTGLLTYNYSYLWSLKWDYLLVCYMSPSKLRIIVWFVFKISEFCSAVLNTYKQSAMEIVTLTHGKCSGTTCEIYKYGATITSWKVAGGENNIFVR